MKPEELIKIAISSGYEVVEYDSHYCVRKNVEISVIVTIPKVPQLVIQLVDRIKRDAGIMIKRASGKREYSLYFRFLQKP